MFVCVAGSMVASCALGAVDLMLVPLSREVSVGEEFEVAVYMASDSGEPQLVAAAQVMVGWLPEHLQLLGTHQDGAVELLSSGFPANDPYGVNESVPPQDGDGMYQALAPLGMPAEALPGGTLLTTVRFLAFEPAIDSPLLILPEAGAPPGETVVYDGTTPNTNITGMLFSASVTIVLSCPADLNGDELVNVFDLLVLLGQWGNCDAPDGCAADLNGDETINVFDLLELLGAWGACP